MISLLLFGIVASAWAAPQFDYRHHGHPSPYFYDYHMRREPFQDDLFDTSKFWADISKELREIDDMLADFSRHFPTSMSREGIEGNEYRITIPLSGFEEKDVVVKAREGLLMIQASRNAGVQRNYLDIRTLPDSVNVNGTWTFDKSVLTIVFPLKDGARTTDETVTVMTTEYTTTSPFVDREEVESNHNEDNETVNNADVGLDRGDQAKETELMTNEIPDRNSVEATTYAVDLKDEVEFVPVRF